MVKTMAVHGVIQKFAACAQICEIQFTIASLL